MQFVKTLTERNLETLRSTEKMWGVEEQRTFEIAITVEENSERDQNIYKCAGKLLSSAFW